LHLHGDNLSSSSETENKRKPVCVLEVGRSLGGIAVAYIKLKLWEKPIKEVYT
ncbi:hypothetical protein JOQ06_022566, partial [Pogonophryne albipinna]